MHEFDLKKAKRAKIVLSKENKSLKETTTELETNVQELENKANKELKEENERLMNLLKEAEEKANQPKTEQDIVDDFSNLTDIQSMYRVMNIVQMNFNQKYYAYMATQQKPGVATSNGTNGGLLSGDQMNGGYMMGGQMMNPMPHMGMFSGQNQSNVNNPSQQ
mmetsp:Transcript_1854/g.1651  ORF Transcript_1854/g.1651 Transcript_1854/m.1651 type:complete len:163 (+) Transcript_1854:243-731(+)